MNKMAVTFSFAFQHPLGEERTVFPSLDLSIPCCLTMSQTKDK